MNPAGRPSPSGAARSGNLASNSGKPRVLVIDDTPANLMALGAGLSADYEVQIATSGEVGLALAEAHRPDLILLDIMMPDLDGYTVCRRLKDNPLTQPIPVIFVSALNDPRDQEKGFALGAADYIIKPFLLPLVLARVRVHVSLKLKSELLENLAFIDGLTDVPNRRALNERLAEELARCKRQQSALAVLMLDIDCFKALNDSNGHAAGDACLRRLGQALRQSLNRPGDFVGRYGGEEFCVILPDVDAAGTLALAEKLRVNLAALRISHPASPIADHVTVSIGCVCRQPDPHTQADDLLREADQALYRAKAGGRNRVELQAGRTALS